ncbi:MULTISPECIES: SMI1/KNR4 family protein [Pseudomonas]|uniref:SMI1/KNR4 family protein n=1 Tax=Pseudomonas TaxID=286 RepID=UPI001BE5D328|nr:MULTISPECIES: SMI1/KNR4 family protein [Pseudomonas]MBT2342158.1 SMI1/KNR4 family protein [Pseudomonas fluorescens]MCD4530002.1 SMI1/KNR4 family protein [Pseudomonas sp. C3-2018]
MRLILEDSEHTISVQELNEFQEKFNVELPTAFRNFYLRHNGGNLSESSSENEFLLGGFTPIKYGEAPIETVYRDLTDDVPSLKGMIPFAYDQGGNSFLLSVKTDDFGNVYLYLMDEEDLAFVCESFEEFLTELTNQ